MSAFTWPPDPSTPGELPQTNAEVVAAAVLVPLFDVGGDPHLVLTRRHSDLRKHAGEIAFPGGRRDAEDADLSETALREAEEEIGLPRSQASLLGELPPTSTFVTGYLIHPFVASIPPGLKWEPSQSEVDAVLELPLQQVRDARQRIEMTRRGFTFETDAYLVGEHLIWGATARIIENLLERLDEGLPPGPAPGARP